MLLRIDFSSETPIFMQIRNQIVLGIADGHLPPGDKLPTIRALSGEMGINMMTVNKAYQLLKQEGYISADRRLGAVVNGPIPGGEMPPGTRDSLRLLISEAKVHGVGRTDFIRVCDELFQELEG